MKQSFVVETMAEWETINILLPLKAKSFPRATGIRRNSIYLFLKSLLSFTDIKNSSCKLTCY